MCNALKLIVYHNAERAGLVENITSLQWKPAFCNAGEFKLVCAATAENRALLVPDALLYNPDTPGQAALVLAVEADGNACKLTVRGKFSLCRLTARVARGTYVVTEAASALLRICRENLRGLAVEIPQGVGFTAPCSETIAWQDCCTAAVQLAKAGGFGVRMRFDPASATETLELTQGKNRSAPGTELYNGYFSTRMQNLTGAVYTEDTSSYANVILCGGEPPAEGDSFTRYFCEVGDLTATGNARRELWVDGSSVTHRHTVQGTDGTTAEAVYSEAEYQTVLQNYARAALTAHMSTRELKCTAADTTMRYGEDYNLGDRVPLRIEELGLDATAQVSAVCLIYENGVRTRNPVLDNFIF